jgi:uncharacterized protein (TIGR01777 family)
MKGAVTGTHGFIGSRLVRRLEERGDEVVRLVRRDPAGPGEVRWDPDAGAVDAAGIDGLDYVVHLAGANIGARPWTPGQRRRIRDSRVRGTETIARAIATLRSPPSTLLSASANGFYGDRGEDVLDESAGPGEGFRAEVCRAWEAATKPAEDAGIRVAHLRSGLVLSRRGGLFPFLSLWRFVPRLGSGKQWWSWITLEDEVDAIVHLLRRDDIAGPVNLTSPGVVRQAEFAATLAEVKRGLVFPVPAPLLKLGLGPARAREVLLSSERVVPSRLIARGYLFHHEDLATALHAIYSGERV